LFLRGALPYPGRLRLGAHLVRAYQRSGLQKLVRKPGVHRLLPRPLAELEAQLPVMGGHFFGPTRRVYRAQGERKLTVGLLSGCVMPLMQGSTMRAAVRVLTRNGCDVLVPVGQGCCGALNLHSGDLEFGRRMARRNIDVFLAAGVDRIVVASAGCSAAMKEYLELLKDDPHYAEKARRFSQVTVDITELLVSLPFDPPKPPSREENPPLPADPPPKPPGIPSVPPLIKGGVGGFGLPQRVTYQDPCHLAHAQRITAAPRTILKSIPGLELVEMENAAMCCGGAGIYWMVQQELSRKILDRKLEAIAAAGAEAVVTANPGCVLQIEQGLSRRGIHGKVWHVVDLLDRAYQAEGNRGGSASADRL
jgi:Fe-S oxidoreductase